LSPTMCRRGAWSIPTFGAGLKTVPGNGSTRCCGATSPGARRPPPAPSAALSAAQSVKTTARGGDHGCERAQKVNGRKHPILGATLGRLMAVVGTAANGQDRAGAKQWWPLLRHGLTRLRCLGAAGASAGALATGVGCGAASGKGAWSWANVPRRSQASSSCPKDGGWNGRAAALECIDG
jgi:hypothetical protein